ncbi:hypothetical protein V2G26_013771 [Clonostachys chloroleuca]
MPGNPTPSDKTACLQQQLACHKDETFRAEGPPNICITRALAHVIMRTKRRPQKKFIDFLSFVFVLGFDCIINLIITFFRSSGRHFAFLNLLFYTSIPPRLPPAYFHGGLKGRAHISHHDSRGFIILLR